MEQKRPSIKAGLWLALAIVAVAAVLSVMAFYNRLSFLVTLVPPFTVNHWFSYIGATFIAFYTPAFYYLKRRYKTHYQTFVRIHVFGNLLSIMLISIHFGWHEGKLGGIFQDPRTGLPLYIALLVMLVTGINLRFQVSRKWLKPSRFTHLSFMAAFYLIVFFHVLHGIGIA